MDNFAEPIEVIDIFGNTTPADYVQPDRYEIMWREKRWTVNAEHQIQGPTDEADALIDPGFRVRNRRS